MVGKRKKDKLVDCSKSKVFLDLKDSLQRLQAEFENYKKREEVQRKNFQEFCNAKLVESLLPVLDSMDKAIEHGKSNGGGFELIRSQFFDVLKRNGLEEIDSVGKDFDPMIHESISFVEDKGKKNGVVLEELVKGFLFKGKLLRAAKVVVNKIEGDKK